MSSLIGKSKEFCIIVCTNYYEEIEEHLTKNNYEGFKDYFYFAKPINIVVNNLENYTDKYGNKIIMEEHFSFNMQVKVCFYGRNNILKIGKECRNRNLNIVFYRDYGYCCIGEKTQFSGSISIGKNAKVKIGKCVSVGQCSIVSGAGSEIVIGDDCMISTNVRIENTDYHPIIDVNSGKIINRNNAIEILNHVWLGRGCTILGGSKIGNSSIVGCNSVVKKIVSNNCCVAGSPCKVTRKNITWNRFDMCNSEIEELDLFPKDKYWNETI